VLPWLSHKRGVELAVRAHTVAVALLRLVSPVLIAASIAALGACGETPSQAYSPPPSLTTPGALAGRLCNRNNGQWLGGATVTLDDVASTSATADNEGRFKINGLKPGLYRIKVEQGDYQGERSGSVYPGETTDIGAVECDPLQGSIVGRICDSSNDTWLANAEVSVALSPTVTLRANTGAKGSYRQDGVPLGVHTVLAKVVGGTKTFNARVRAFDTAVVGDQACGADGAVAGRVLTVDSAPLAGVVVSLATAGLDSAASTDSDGRFVLYDVPGGVHDLVFSRGSNRVTVTAVEVAAGHAVELRQPVVFVPSAKVAVITGAFDAFEGVLYELGHRLARRFDASGETVVLADGNVDLIDGASDYWLTAFLADKTWLGRYDIVVFNCGLDDTPLLAEGTPEGLRNVASFVSAGHAAYFSDWSYDVLRLAFPGRIAFEGDDAKNGSAKLGMKDTALAVRVVEDPVHGHLAQALGLDEATLNLELPGWVMLEPLTAQASDLYIYVVTDQARQGTRGTNISSPHPHTPVVVRFAHGAGTVYFSSARNEVLTTPDLNLLLRFMAFEL
jgi:hypothetical protein